MYRPEHAFYQDVVDLTKAFDTVSREALWIIPSKLGCPRKFVNVLCMFHNGMKAWVSARKHTEIGEDISDPIFVDN